MVYVTQTATYKKWENKLKDSKARAIIKGRLLRVVDGIYGDVYPVGDGVRELRIHYGPGYRIYFKQRAEEVTILLCGGNKSTQSRDIEMAKKLVIQLGI